MLQHEKEQLLESEKQRHLVELRQGAMAAQADIS